MATRLKNPQIFRVFFSSPFKGMEEEREELTRKYIPQIQHKCSEMGLQFVTVDMRWGISVESAQQAQTINICLREIDRSDMFVCFFGQRYGWHGQNDSLLQENINAALGKYPWLDEARQGSVTEIELRHGFLNSPGDLPSVVCFRDEKYDDIMKNLHKHKAASYVVEDDASKEKLSQLKQEVLAAQSQAVAVHMDYPNPLEGARLIYEAVIKYLEENVLKQSEELTKREKNIAPHKAFAVSRTSLYVADQEQYDFLNNALRNAGPNRGDDEKCHVLITGPAGCGKSSLLCNWLQNHVFQEQDVVVIPYYIACAPNTGDPEELLGCIYYELDHHLTQHSKTDDTKEGNIGNNSNRSDNTKSSDKGQEGDQGRESHSQIKTESISSDKTQVVADEDKEKAALDGPEKPANETNNIGSKEEQSATLVSDQTSSLSDKPINMISLIPHQLAGSANSTAPDNRTDSDESKKSDKTADADSKEDATKTKTESRPKGKELQHQVVKKLEDLVEKGHKVVLVFDAVNRLFTTSKISKTLYWLPEKLPKGVLCLVSTEDTDQASIDVLQTERGFRVLKIGPLKEAAQATLCVETLKHSGKELSQGQLDRIIKCEQTENPLYLKIVLAELSIFGYFRKLDEKIDTLIKASSIKELLRICLERLEADYNDVAYEGNLVGEILKAIYVSHQGLTENEIISIFKIPSNIWSPLFFAMEFFIVTHEGKMGFAFGEIREAVQERYLQDPSAKARAREKLISYFDGIRMQLRPWMTRKKLSEKHVEHAIVELVWLQRKQEDKAAVARTLTDLAVFKIMNDEHDLELLELWQWTGLKWSEVCCELLKAVDVAIADCYLATEEGELDKEKSPGVRMRAAIAHMRSFFDLANFLSGQEKVLEREIRILENAEGHMEEELRKEYLRDAHYYLACTYASQDRYQEAKALHESNMTEFQSALAEKDDPELRKQIAYTHNGLGILCMHSGEYEQGIDHLLQSSDFHNKNKDRKNEAAGYTNLGLIYMYKQEFEKALEYNNKAIEAYEEGQFGQLSMDLGNVYTNIGLVYRRMKNLDKAEEAYLKSIQLKANSVGWDHVVIATAFMNLGTLEMHRKNYAKAEEWTRKAIAVYEANEFAVTKKEFRRCRENLFANMVRGDKYEESLPLFLEVFDILNKNGWLDECLAWTHRKMVGYILENKSDLYEKAAEVCMALIDSPKAHPENYSQLVSLDLSLPEHKRVERPYHYSLDACLDRFPNHRLYPVLIQLKLSYLLPKDDKVGIRTLLKHAVTNYTDSNFEEIIANIIEEADDQNKNEFCFQCMKSLIDEDPIDKRVLQLFIRFCVQTKQPEAAVPYIDSFLNSCKEEGLEFKSSNIKPSRTKKDVAEVLTAKGCPEQAQQLLSSDDCKIN